MQREPISAFIITFNEEERLVPCLKSLSFCDEIVIIDSYSTDATLEIARQFRAKILQRKWEGYVSQKTFGLSQVTHDWVINVDADERVSPELRESILNVLASPSEDVEGYLCNRVVFHLGRWWRRGGWYPEYRLRFFRRRNALWGGMDPHERVEVPGRTPVISGELYHFSYRNLGDQFGRLDRYSSISAVEEFKNGKRATAFKIIANPIARFIKFYLIKGGYREGVPGIIMALAESYYTLMKYAKLWELQHQDEFAAAAKKVDSDQ
jgi:glycosyltransferase involved in cell wall biosynthesis